MRNDKCGCCVNRKLSSVFEDVSNRVLSINLLLHDTVLVDTDSLLEKKALEPWQGFWSNVCESTYGQDIQNGLVHRIQTINNESDSDTLPSRNAWRSDVRSISLEQSEELAFFLALPPILAGLCFADIANINHDTVKCAPIQRLVLKKEDGVSHLFSFWSKDMNAHRGRGLTSL